MRENRNGPRASVVVPAHDAAGTIGACMRALQQQSLDRSCYEIIVVDDGSGDATAEIATGAGARVLRQPQKGAAAARNRGIEVAQGELVCFTDADCEPTPEWLAQITAPLADPLITGCKGRYATRQRSLVARFVQVEYEDKYDLLAGQRYIDFIDTYSAAYRRQALVANGGFDETIRYVEDQELSFRLDARGYKMVFQPQAVVFHRHVATLAGYFRKKFFIGYWKAQIVRRFPERGVKDSHTPQVMKVQMGLMALLLLAAGSSLIFPWAGAPLATLLLLAFLLTTPPFLGKCWQRDRLVTFVAPLLLAVRALALGFGYLWGIVRPLPGVSGSHSTIGGFNYVAKRSLDVAAGLGGVATTLLLTPLIALAIKLDSPGPVFFRQERVGQGGELFTILKFRSMHKGAEAELERLLALQAPAEPILKLADDPRRTRVGKFLRRWSLDELPQFWNVLRGEMSLVGPRPEEKRIVAHYTDWHRRRLAVKPGITGPMQVNGRGDLSLDERVRLELEYIEHYSFWRDLRLLAATIPAVIRGKGAW